MKTLNCVLVWSLLFFAVADLWAIPPGFNIQGRLTDTNGINKEGTFQIKFSVFTVDNALAWEKNMPAVLVQNGNFQVVLRGEGLDFAGAAVQLENAVKNLEEAYLEIKVGSDPPLVPRQPLLRSPFSSADKFIGAVMFFAGPTCPDGWLLANGAILPVPGVDAAKQADLLNYLGTVYDPAHVNVKLPNLVDGAFIRGTGGNAGALGTKQMDAFQGHRHSYYPSIAQGTWSDQRGIIGAGTGGNVGDPSRDSSGIDPRTALETRPLNYAMTPCVKY